MTTPHDRCDFWCIECARWSCRDAYPSPCEDHDICSDCAPCDDCRDDAREEAEIRDRREGDAA